MPRLPDATDLGATPFQETRSVPNVPVADYAGAFGSLGKGFAAVGAAAADYADEQEKNYRDEESFKTNLSLLKAEETFATNTQGLDPSDPEYAAKRMKAWSDVFKPIIEGVKDPKNQMKFGEWAAERGTRTQLTSMDAAYKAKGERTQLDLLTTMQEIEKRVADGKMSPEEGASRMQSLIETAPGLTSNDRLQFDIQHGSKFRGNLADTFGLQLVGNAREAPGSWAPFQQDLGAFTRAMKERGFDIVLTSNYRTPEYQAEIRAKKYNELIAQGKTPAQAQAHVDEFFAVPSENMPHARGASDLAVRTPDGKIIRLGDDGSEEAKKAAHELAPSFNLSFRLNGKNGTPNEPWHVEPLNPNAAPAEGGAPAVVDKSTSRANMLAVFQASPVYQNLSVSAREAATKTFLSNYDTLLADDEQERLLGETRTVVDELVAKFPKTEDRDAARAELRTRVKDPAFFEKGLVLLDSTYERNDATTKAEQAAVYADAQKIVMAAITENNPEKAIAAIPAPGKLPDDDRARLLELVRTKGGPKKDNAWVADDLFAKSVSGDKTVQIAFANLDLSKYDDQLSRESLNSLRAKQEAILKGAVPDAGVQTHAQLFDGRMRELGIDMSNDADPATFAVRNRITTLVDRNLAEAKKRKNGPLTDTEASQVIDRTFMQFRGKQSTWLGLSSEETNLGLDDVLPRLADYETKKAAIPGSTLNTIYSSFYARQDTDRATARRIIETSTDPAAVAAARIDLSEIDKRQVDASYIALWLDRSTGTQTQTQTPDYQYEGTSLGN
jgi:hypothetical protein